MLTSLPLPPPVLQHEHGGPVLLRPLVPHPVGQPAGACLALAADVEEGQAVIVVVVETLPVPLIPHSDNIRIRYYLKAKSME